MKAVFRDSIYHKNKNKINLLMVVSIDQIHQSGSDFQKFCNLVNENKDRINNLVIVETGHLKRHYIRIKQATSLENAAIIGQEAGKAWVSENKLALNTLEIPYQIVSWQSLVEDSEFKEKLLLTVKNYQEDSIFKKIVDEVGGNYAKKFYLQLKELGITSSFDECIEAAKDYLIEESTIAHKLVKMGDFQAYPGRSNPAVSYVYKKYFGESDPLPWVRYRTDIKEKHSKNGPLLKSETGIDRFEVTGKNGNQNGNGLGIFNQYRDKNRLLQTVVYTLDTLDLTEYQEKIFMQQFIQLLANVQSIKEEVTNDKQDQSKITQAFH